MQFTRTGLDGFGIVDAARPLHLAFLQPRYQPHRNLLEASQAPLAFVRDLGKKDLLKEVKALFDGSGTHFKISYA
jgi:hypothetical protein